MNFGPAEWIVVALIIVLLFGAKKLPELARSLGKSSSEFKKGMKEGGQSPPADESGAEASPQESPAEPKSD